MKRAFHLTLHGKPEGPTSWTSGPGVFIAGADPSCDLVLDVEGVAAHHATLWLESDRVQLEDIGSGVGTLVNGYDISGRVEVEYPASISMGKAVLVVERVYAPGTQSGQPSEFIRSADNPGDREGGGEISGAPVAGAVAGAVAGDAVAGDAVAGDAVSEVFTKNAVTQAAYRLKQEIAAGGMGRIYHGEDAQLHREVAVKVSKMGEGCDPRFIKEAKVLAQLAHPNIVPIHALGVDEDGFPFYSMKLVKGKTLQEIIRGLKAGDAEMTGAYTRERLLDIFRKVCDAIAFSHSRRVIHRDLKPDNIMVGEFGEVLVMDWGLAKHLDEMAPPAALSADSSAESSAPAAHVVPLDSADLGATLDGEVMGTPQYMSPEQASGRAYDLDERTDIYALGAILYAILTLRPPVEGATLDELLSKVRSGEIAAMATRRTKVAGRSEAAPKPGEPAAMGAGIPTALKAVTRRAMALHREDRYQTVEALSSDVEAYLSGFATRAEEAGLLRQLVLLVRRHKAPAAMILLMVVSGAVFTVKLFASERAARESARIAEDNKRSAEENAQKAIDEKEVARRASAQAHIALAEAAERELDGEEMQRTLAEVPKDLRDQKWEYLDSKLESAELNVLSKDGAPFTFLAPHPQRDGALVTLQSNGWLRTLDLRTGKIEDLLKLEGSFQADFFALSRDAKRVAFLRHQRERGQGKFHSAYVSLVQIEGGQKQNEMRVPVCANARLSFSPDGSQLLCEFVESAGGAQRFQVYETSSGKLVWERPPDGRVFGEYSGDGSKIRAMTERSGVLELDAKTGAVVKELAKIPMPASSGLAWHYAAAPDWGSVYLAQSSPAKFIRKVETSSGKNLFENRTPEVRGMGMLQDSGTVVTLSVRSDRCVTLQYWHGVTGLLIKSVPVLGGLKGGWRLAVHPKSGEVAVVNGSRLRVWRFQVAKPLKTFECTGRLSCVFLDSPGQLLRRANRGPAFLEGLDIRDPDFQKKPFFSISDPSFNGSMLSSSQNGSVVAMSSNPVRIFRKKGGSLAESFKGSMNGAGEHFQLSPAGDKLWTGIAVYDTSSGKMLCQAERQNVEFPPIGSGASRWVGAQRVAEVGMVKADWEGASPEAMERAILLWDAETGKRLLAMDAPDADAISVSGDGKKIAEAGADMRIRIRDGETLEVEKEFRAHDGAITDVVWHPKLPLLVTASEDLTVRIWNLKDGHLLEELRGIAAQPEQRPDRVAISPDGSWLYVSAGGTHGIYQPACFTPLKSKK
jgi:serine/threonine protein kinase/WD40 repeat protein